MIEKFLKFISTGQMGREGGGNDIQSPLDLRRYVIMCFRCSYTPPPPWQKGDVLEF